MDLRHSRLSQVFFVVSAALSAVLLVNHSAQQADAVAQFSSTRVYYQPHATTKWGVWSGETCPGNARYDMNYGCVYANSVSSHSTLRYTNLDGSGTTDIHINCASGTNPQWQAPWLGVNKILVDEINGKLYWENSFEPGIGRANLDGTGCELVAQAGYYGKGYITLDSTATYMYSVQNNAVRRVTLSNGTVTPLTFTGVEVTVTGLGDMVVHNGKLYVAINNSGSAGHIMEATIDTTTTAQSAQLIVTGQPVGVLGLAVDAVNNKIYWGTGSAVKRSNLDGTSIETVYTGAVNFVQVIPTENKILVGSEGNNMQVMDLNGGNVMSLNVKSRGFVTAVVTNMAPPTTTTIPTTTTAAPTTTTVAPTTTTVAATTSTAVAVAEPSATVAPSQSATSETRTTRSTSPAITQTTIASLVPTTSSTTTTTTTTTVPPAPEVDGGDGVVVIDGVETAVAVSRSDNRFTISTGDVSATLTGITASGEIAALDEDGAVRLTNDDLFEIELEGLAPNSAVEVWMYSTPNKLGVTQVNASGQGTERYAIEDSVSPGAHRIVLRGENSDGKKLEIAFGMFIGFENSTSTAARVVIIVPIVLALLFGLLLPTALRRRRNEVSV